MQTKTITIINKLGLHARASMKLVDTANRFSSSIQLNTNDKKADAKDILEVMSLGAPIGTQINLQVDGSDEVEAITAIDQLIQNRFGEAE